MPLYYVKVSNAFNPNSKSCIQCYEFDSDDEFFTTIRLWGERSKKWGYSTKYEHVPKSCVFNMFGDQQWYSGRRVDIPERFKRFDTKK